MGDLFDGCFGDPSAAAVIDHSGTVSWAELVDRIDRLVGHFRSLGLPPGASILVLSTNRREVVEIAFACLQGGWEVAPVNWHFTAAQVAQVLGDLDVSVVVVDPALVGLLVAAISDAPDGAFVEALVLDDGSMGDERPEGFGSYEWAIAASRPDGAGATEPASVVFYTSGTTGRARGVRTTGPSSPLGALADRALATIGAVGLPDRGRSLLCGPHYHWAQWTFGVAMLLRGSTLIIHHRFVPAQVLRAIDEHAVTNLVLVPTQFVRLLRLDDPTRAAFHGSSLVRVVHGAAPCAPETKRAMIAWWGPVFTEYYGATEGGTVSLIDTAEWLERPGSVGRPAPWSRVEVVADDGTLAAPGVDGVIHVRDLQGLDIEFVGAPAVTTAVHARPGTVTFSDIGRLDADGYLYLSDRTSDMIVRGGTNVSSGDVEAVLLAHPAVADVAVFGVPDPDSGQDVVAGLQLTDGQSWSADLEADLIQWCAARLAPHQRPVRFEHAEDLPRTSTGKLVKRRLRARAWGYPVD